MRRSLLSHFAPATAVLLLRVGASRDGVDDTLVCELAATDEFVCESAAVEGGGVGVDGVGDDLRFGGQEQQLLDEVVDCEC